MNQPSPKPEPVVASTVCSLCDESWEAHGDEPTVLDCIRLLKAKRQSPPTPNIWPTTRWCATCQRYVGLYESHAHLSFTPSTTTTTSPRWVYTTSAPVLTRGTP